METKQIIFSENGDIAYGNTNDFKTVSDFIEAVNEHYHEEVCWVDNIRIEPCISTLEGIEADSIVPISSTNISIENYYVGEVSEIGIAGVERK